MTDNSPIIFVIIIIAIYFLFYQQQNIQQEILSISRDGALSLVDLREFRHLDPSIKEIYKRTIVDHYLPQQFQRFNKLFDSEGLKKHKEQIIDALINASSNKLQILSKNNNRSIDHSEYLEDELLQNEIAQNGKYSFEYEQI
jgi:hypothetical protein